MDIISIPPGNVLTNKNAGQIGRHFHFMRRHRESIRLPPAARRRRA
jgi:hypothetical protein